MGIQLGNNATCVGAYAVSRRGSIKLKLFYYRNWLLFLYLLFTVIVLCAGATSEGAFQWVMQAPLLLFQDSAVVSTESDK
jgi:hypothetical protein